MRKKPDEASDALSRFQEPVRDWFRSSFPGPTSAQQLGWAAIAGGESTLILAPTGSGKTLTAFLWCLDQLMFTPPPPTKERCRVLYISPLKALAVDVEKNLRAPLAGISRTAGSLERSFHLPEIAVRTGDTPSAERDRFRRAPADILITTPESLYLLLTSSAREVLRSITTVIIDEIHALVPTKRGAHLALSLERLEEICETPPQRIGLSATQRPLEEVARFLGGCRHAAAPPPIGETEALEAIVSERETGSTPEFRPVTIVDTGERKQLSLRVEVPVEDMGSVGEVVPIPSGPASSGAVHGSIWPALHPRLLELIRAHRSTLLFVNSRRLSERLAAALNELAGETLVRSHHGSLAREQRVEIEERLKSGDLPALVATSSLELGIDMGAIDLVIQIEAPPTVASGLQRIGRAAHQAGAVSNGVIFPKFRGDLIACAAVTEAMKEGRIEFIRYPRNPLDVLAQQIVAMVALDDWPVESVFDVVRRAAPFAHLTRAAFEGVLDLLSGVYPSDEFAELRPRVTWNRIEGTLTARAGSRSVAVLNGGTIPDRGLYGVFLAGAEKGGRVGELDEEMVFESRRGETFLLGASTWKIEEITHDRVLVSPAPGEPGKMPFWHGDAAGRSVELGEEIGRLIRRVREAPDGNAAAALVERNDLDPQAAENLIAYVAEQVEATQSVPDERTIVIERCRDELGDWRICVLTPWGGRVHAPWAMAVTARIRDEKGIDVETMWGDDGFVIRFPESDEAPDPALFVPSAEEVEGLVVRQLGSTSLFAAKFRENATRALLLPRRAGAKRSPLWQQRKRASDLLAVAARFPSFPILLETYRECLLDVFDMRGLAHLLRQTESRTIRVVTVDTELPSPFASSLLFRYVANYIYDGDAPLAERRAQALSIDHAQLRELLGDAPLRDLLDPAALELLELRLQRLDENHRARHADGLHDLLLSLGDLSLDAIERRTQGDFRVWIEELVRQRRILQVTVAGEQRYIAAEDAGRYREALGTPLPPGVPARYLQPVADPLGDLVARHARTHGPFTTEEVRYRYGIGGRVAQEVLDRLAARGKLLEGEFRPGGERREWCDSEVLRTLRRQSLAKLRHEVEPVDREALARLMLSWQGVGKPREGDAALYEIVETLQGHPLAASVFEREILGARLLRYRESQLDRLAATGEIVWLGLEPVGERDGRIALFIRDQLALLRPEPRTGDLSDVEQRVLSFLGTRGASFFAQIQASAGGFPAEVVDALWSLVWRGLVTNDSFHALRSYTRPPARGRVRRGATRTVPGTEGRWTLVEHLVPQHPTATERSKALAEQLLARYGVLARDAVNVESISGGFSAVYDVLKGMEERGRVRRGYFVAGVSAMQFALPAALDLLRTLREPADRPQRSVLAATDPANPWGGVLPWPERTERRSLMRVVGARVILVDGFLAAYVSRGEKQIHMFLPDDDVMRLRVLTEVAAALAADVRSGSRRAVLITEIDGGPALDHALAPFLQTEGFVVTAQGLHLRAGAAAVTKGTVAPEEEMELDEDVVEDA